ncbi:hypothetical protein [Sphingomonas profundi]|uniref:hypothetical protein n=1 Tax=Alterirhizorhabdus profundi TaxID=2681549 RepID=UPI0012E845CE|nr:hypothetical protein [Sphingomonas profundi]
MLHVVVTMMFLGSGMLALTVIAAMLVDHAGQIALALGLRRNVLPPLPVPAARVRVVRSPRLTPLSPARLRAAA